MPRLRLDPFSPNGVSVITEITKVEQRGGHGWLQSNTIGGGGGTTSPLTTKGDLYTYSTTDDRLPVGSNGQVLSADSSTSTGLKWIAASAGSGGIARTVTVTSGNYTLGSTASTDYVYFVAGAHTGTMPTTSGNTNRYTIKNNHSVNVTINRAGSDTIEGGTSLSLPPGYSVDLISDGTSAWYVI